MSTPMPPPDSWQPPPDSWQPPPHEAAGNPPSDVHQPRPQPITWTPKLRSPALTIVLLLLVTIVIVFSASVDRWTPTLVFCTLLAPTAAAIVTIVNLRQRRHFPYTAVIDHAAVWLWTPRSPLVTELSRREGGLLRLTRRGQLLLLAVVRPDGTATAPMLVADEVIEALRGAALRAGWAWQGLTGPPDYPAQWDPQPFPPPKSPVLLTPPVRPARVPARIVRPLVLVGMSAAILACLVLTDSGVITWLVVVAGVAILVHPFRRRARSAPGQVLDVSPEVVRVIHPLFAIVLTRDAPARMVIDATDLRIVDQEGRTVFVVHCPVALPAVRAELTRLGWPVSPASHR